jgi:hypothetical protein
MLAVFLLVLGCGGGPTRTIEPPLASAGLADWQQPCSYARDCLLSDDASWLLVFAVTDLHAIDRTATLYRADAGRWVVARGYSGVLDATEDLSHVLEQPVGAGEVHVDALRGAEVVEVGRWATPPTAAAIPLAVAFRMSPDGAHVYEMAVDPGPHGGLTGVRVLDAATGQPTATIPGRALYDWWPFSEDAQAAIVWSDASAIALDPATGAQVPLAIGPGSTSWRHARDATWLLTWGAGEAWLTQVSSGHASEVWRHGTGAFASEQQLSDDARLITWRDSEYDAPMTVVQWEAGRQATIPGARIISVGASGSHFATRDDKDGWTAWRWTDADPQPVERGSWASTAERIDGQTAWSADGMRVLQVAPHAIADDRESPPHVIVRDVERGVSLVDQDLPDGATARFTAGGWLSLERTGRVVVYALPAAGG